MTQFSFASFREAAQFAAGFCASNRTTASVIQLADGQWAVKPSDEYQSQKQHEEEERKLSEARQKSEEEESRKTIEREQQTQNQLNKRESYYRTLSKDALQALWDNREILAVDPRERAIIRQLMRKHLGIKPVPYVNVRACIQYGLVGESCTCKRS